jgi:hypothetical protein
MSRSFVSLMSQTKAVHGFTYYFFNMHFNIIFLYTPRYCKWCLSLSFPH